MNHSKNKPIGILGGSFDPPHKGHVKISKIALKKLSINRLYWVITKKNPHKSQPFFQLGDRISKSKKLIKKNKKIKVLYLDGKVKSSRTIGFINYFIKSKKQKNLYFIIGSDNLLDFHKWTSWKKIAKIVKLVVFSRKGYDKKSNSSVVVKYLKMKNIIYIKNKHINISSTILRKSLKRA